MECKIENNSALKTFCLRRRLKKLEAKRLNEIAKFIAYHPIQAARMDNIEKSINSQYIIEVDFKIKAIHRLLSRIGKN